MQDILKLAQEVVAQGAVFGPLVLVVMELLKPLVKGRAARRVLSALLSVAGPVGYQLAQGGIDWRAAPFVWVLAFAIAFAAHKLRNANDAQDSPPG